MSKQITDTILMVRPAHFGYNKETARDNAFQQSPGTIEARKIAQNARLEFDQMVDILREHDINVIVIKDTDEPIKTDAVFPNNWISTHSDGSIRLYPMYSKIRRSERRTDIKDLLINDYNFNKIIDYSHYEQESQYLEGTGSMILDRANGIIFACHSQRTNRMLLDQLARELNYKLCVFDAVDGTGTPYYHTNVIMTLGEKLAVICLESMIKEDRERVSNKLYESGREIVEISRNQVLYFAGNMLELHTTKGNHIMVMSSTAYKNLTLSQKNMIRKYDQIVHTPLDTIEKYGGGSARCMIAEIFRP